MWWITAAHALSLAEAWRAAEENPDQIAVEAEAEAASARVTQSRASWLPKVQLAASYNRADEPIVLDLGASMPPAVLDLTGPIDPIVVQPTDWWQASATLVVPVVDLDGWLRTGAAARATEAARGDADAVERQIRAAVAEAFYGVYVAREAVDIGRDAVALAARQEDIAHRLVTAGAATDRTALEATQARLAAERDLQGAIAAEVGATEALHRLTGLPRDSEVTLGYRADLPDAPDAALPLALSRRPEIAAARARVRAARATVGAASAGWAPDVSARVTGLRTENRGLADDEWFLLGAVEATWTFDGGYRGAQAREGRAHADAAAAALASLERGLEQEIATAYAERVRAQASLRAAVQEVAAANAASEQAERAFASGAATFVEVDRAALGLRAARLSAARERAAAELADVRVALAIGG